MKTVAWFALGAVLALATIGGIPATVKEFAAAGTAVDVFAACITATFVVLLALGARGSFRRAFTDLESDPVVAAAPLPPQR